MTWGPHLEETHTCTRKESPLKVIQDSLSEKDSRASFASAALSVSLLISGFRIEPGLSLFSCNFSVPRLLVIETLSFHRARWRSQNGVLYGMAPGLVGLQTFLRSKGCITVDTVKGIEMIETN